VPPGVPSQPSAAAAEATPPPRPQAGRPAGTGSRRSPAAGEPDSRLAAS
jgi:hypothetical protein